MKINQSQLIQKEQTQQTQDSNSQIRLKGEKTSVVSSDIYIKSCLFKNESLVLSPLIFTRKINTVKFDDRINNQTMFLECMLSLVNKFYYKSTYDVEEFMKELFQVFESQDAELEGKSSKMGRGQHVRISRRIKKNQKEAKTSHTEMNGSAKNAPTASDENNILDYLVSPIKTDFCVGGLTRKLDYQGTGDF